MERDGIKQRIEELRAETFDIEKLTPGDIKKGLLKEAVNAKSSRDRTSAWKLLGNIHNLFSERHEIVNASKEDQLLIADIQKQFGDEAAIRASEQMGYGVSDVKH